MERIGDSRRTEEVIWNRVAAITGSIGSGKSTLIGMLRRRGWQILSADAMARELREPGGAAYASIVSAFGAGILDESGRISSRELGRIVFADPERRRSLESIMLPLLETEAKLGFERLAAEGYENLAYEAPTLFETGAHARGWKKIVLVTASSEARMARLMERDGSTRDEIEARLAAQMPDDEKAKMADVVIDNSSSLEDLAHQADLLDASF